jgi:HOMODA hydrolase
MSDKPLLDYTPMVLVDHLRELMNALGIEKAHLSGESMGGWVSGLFTIEYPERVLKLNLNTAAGLPIITDKGREELQGLIDLTSKATTMGPPTFDSVKNRMKWLFHSNNHDSMITDELVNTRLTCYRQLGSKEVAPKVLAMIGMHDDYLIPMEKIKKETLFLWTEDNPCHDVPCAENSAAKISGSLLYVMKEDAAHWPQYESPEEFNSVIRRFLRTGTV